MTSFQVTQWLRQGIAAAKAGDTEQAYELLVKVVDVDELNEQAWLWLSSVVESDADREVCLENVLAINPDNKLAKAGLVHLRNKMMSRAPAIEPEPEPPPQPEPESVSPLIQESLETLQSDWWDEPQAVEPAFEPTGLWEEDIAIAPIDEPMEEEEEEREELKPRKRQIRLLSRIRRSAVPILLILGLITAGIAFAAQRQIGPFDPSRRNYADAMRPLLAEYETWWAGPQGMLAHELNSLCGPGADGWLNRDVLVTCNRYSLVDCRLLAAHCGADVEAMRQRVDELSQEVQQTGQVLLTAFDAISPPDDIAWAHTRFLACLQARLDEAGRIEELARGEPSTDSDHLPACQMFSFAEDQVLTYVGNP